MNPRFPLAGFYFFYFASIGAFMPYWGPFLASNGFSSAQIGELMAIVLATKIVAPYVWGWFADRSGVRVPIIRWGAFGGLVAFAGVLLHLGYGWLFLVMAVFSFFLNAILPQFEATTLQALGARVHQYALLRLWGSIGFIASVVALGIHFDRHGFAALPWMVWLLLLLLFAVTFLVREPEATPSAQPESRQGIAEVLARPEVIALLLASFFIQASHGPYYTFFTLYVEAQGFSRSIAGQLWALGVVAEVLLFLVMPRIILHWGAWPLMTVALILTTLRWVLLALVPETLAALLVIQILHAASYGVFHAAAISLIYGHFPGRMQGRGQALYSSLSFGLGGGFGALVSGYLWQGAGPASVYVFAAVMAGAGAIIATAGMIRGRP